MNDFTSISDCYCAQIIKDVITDNEFKAICIVIWLLVQTDIMYPNLNRLLSHFSNFILYFTMGKITYYIFIIVTILIITGLFYKRIFSFLNFNKNDILLITILQHICMFYQISFLELSNSSQEFSNAFNFISILCAFLNVIVKAIPLNYFNLILQIWFFGNFYFYGEFMISIFLSIITWCIFNPIEFIIYIFRLNDLWNHMIHILLIDVPTTKLWLLILLFTLGSYICIFFLMVNISDNLLKLKRFTTRNKTNPQLFDFSYIFTQVAIIVFSIGLIFIFEFITINTYVKDLHHNNSLLISLFWTFSHADILELFLCFFTEYEIHKCNNEKFRFLNFSSLLLPVYMIEYLLRINALLP